jgi:hypothetical protein
VKRLLHSRPVDRALRGAALVVTDRRWAAPLSAAALGFGIFAGVAIGPGASGGLATGAQQIVQLPGSSGEEGRSGGGGRRVASTGSALPFEGGGEAGGFEEEALGGATASFAPAPVDPLPAPAPAPAPQPAPAPPAAGEEEEEGQPFAGTVAAANPAAGSYALALDGGELVAVHAPELPEPGTRLSVPLRPLANGTYAAAGEIESEKAKAKAVSLEGVVTWASPPEAPPSYTVSGRGASLLVRVPPDPAGAPAELPAIGSLVELKAWIEPAAEPQAAPTLVQSELEVDLELEPSTYLELAGIVEEVAPDGARLAFSADWSGESEATLDLAVPKSIEAKKLKAGDSYLATAEVGPDGALALTGIAADERAKGADDEASAQGDLRR